MLQFSFATLAVQSRLFLPNDNFRITFQNTSIKHSQSMNIPTVVYADNFAKHHYGALQQFVCRNRFGWTIYLRSSLSRLRFIICCRICLRCLASSVKHIIEYRWWYFPSQREVLIQHLVGWSAHGNSLLLALFVGYSTKHTWYHQQSNPELPMARPEIPSESFETIFLVLVFQKRAFLHRLGAFVRFWVESNFFNWLRYFLLRWFQRSQLFLL